MGTPGHLVVKRYRLVRALGQGGMGIVWEGHDELLDRPVAIKEITPPPGLWPAQEAEFLLRVTHQALAATRVTDPSLVATYDVAEDDGRPWIVMELLPARSLDRVVAHRPPPMVGPALHAGLTRIRTLTAPGDTQQPHDPGNSQHPAHDPPSPRPNRLTLARA